MNSIILYNNTNNINNIPTIDTFSLNSVNSESKIKQINSSNSINSEKMTQFSDELTLRTTFGVGVDLNFNSNLIASLANSLNNNNENDAGLNLIHRNTQSSSSSSSTVSTSSSTNVPSIMNLSNSDKKKQHNCPFCSRSFTRPYRLNDHISFSHTDERKYMCLICSKNFSCKDKLKHHIDSKHDNKKPQQKKSKSKNVEDLRCSFPGCTKAFANKYNVKRHVENVHLKEKRIKDNKNTDNSNENSNSNNSSDEDETMNSSLETTTATLNQLDQPKIALKSNKIEPSSTSTPILSTSISKNKSKFNRSIPNNSFNNNNNALVNQTAPLTLVNVNSIGGITLTALGSIHQQHQQQIQQQQQFVPIVDQSQLTLNLVSNGSMLALSNNNQLIEQQQSQQPIIYQQPVQVLQQALNFTHQQQPVNKCNNNSKNQKFSSNDDANKILKTNNSSESLNAVTVAAAAELVNSLLANSENASANKTMNNNIIGEFDVISEPNYTTNDLKNSNKITSNQTICNQRQLEENQQIVDDEKDDTKIYTCARCPEIFTSSILLRKHVSDHHEKEYECCICNINFNNRFTFLKHKYFHMNLANKDEIDEKIYDNGLNGFKCSDAANRRKKTNNSKTNAKTNKYSNEKFDLYDLNTLYKRCLVNRNTMVDVNMTIPARSQMAINSKKAKEQTNGSVNFKQDESNALVKLVRQNSCCNYCRKCISERKKLIAHKKICSAKYERQINDMNKKNHSIEYDDETELEDEESESKEEISQVENDDVIVKESQKIDSINSTNHKSNKTKKNDKKTKKAVHLIIDPKFMKDMRKEHSNKIVKKSKNDKNSKIISDKKLIESKNDNEKKFNRNQTSLNYCSFYE